LGARAIGRQQTIAVAVSTLSSSPCSNLSDAPSKAVDRRFDRARYDALQTIAAFTGRLRNDIDLESVSNEITRTAVTAVRPASASVWLRGR
jgi:hypothetical protein